MPNQQQDAPLEYYRVKYRGADPERIAVRTGAPFDPVAGRFRLEAFGSIVYASWPDFALSAGGPGKCPDALLGFAAQILVIRFLTEGAHAPAQGRFKAYRELPWGDVYDANFQGRAIKRLARRFGTNIGAFEKAAVSLGGVKRGLGDASYDLPFFGGVICRVILWAPEEDFPPSAQFLFSDNTPAAFNAEDLAAVGDVVISALLMATG